MKRTIPTKKEDVPLYPGDEARDSFGRSEVGMRVQDLLRILIRFHPETRLYVGFQSRVVPLDRAETTYVEEGALAIKGIVLVPKS